MANSTTDIEQAFSDIINNIQQSVRKNISLYVNSGRQKMKILNEFALLLSTIVYIQFGNLLKMSYYRIAKDIKIERVNFSSIIKKFKLAKLIININGNLYLNPPIIAKGNFKETSEEDMKILDKTAIKLECPYKYKSKDGHANFNKEKSIVSLNN